MITDIKRGMLITFVSPSGVGKTTVLNHLMQTDSNITRSISVTTRAPRKGEVNGLHYHFKTDEQFNDLVEKGSFLEHATVFGKSYGVLKSSVEEALQKGFDLGFAIDWQGHLSLKKAMPNDVIGFYLLPPSEQEVLNRLKARGDDQSVINQRIGEMHSELSHRTECECDYEIVNDRLEECISQVYGCIRIEREKRNTIHLEISHPKI